MKACNGCGRCCENAGNGGISATREDLEHWETYRPDIAQYADGMRIWVDPKTGMYLSRCPFLSYSSDGKRSSCQIYHDRPEDCRHYPVDVDQMVRDDCEMLEPRDRKDWRRAQRDLDMIMADSRPPLDH